MSDDKKEMVQIKKSILASYKAISIIWAAMFFLLALFVIIQAIAVDDDFIHFDEYIDFANDFSEMNITSMYLERGYSIMVFMKYDYLDKYTSLNDGREYYQIPAFMCHNSGNVSENWLVYLTIDAETYDGSAGSPFRPSTRLEDFIVFEVK